MTILYQDPPFDPQVWCGLMRGGVCFLHRNPVVNYRVCEIRCGLNFEIWHNIRSIKNLEGLEIHGMIKTFEGVEGIRVETMGQSEDDPFPGSFKGLSNFPSMGIPNKVGSGAWRVPLGDVYHTLTDASLFSTSLPVLPHEKLNFNEAESRGQSTDESSSVLGKLIQDEEDKDSPEDVNLHEIGSLLPDEDELLAGVLDDFDLSRLPGQLEDLEDYDIFGSGGGMEMEYDPHESLSIGMSKMGMADGDGGDGMNQYGSPNNMSAVAGEHPYGEHPSRTLFVRNINSNVEDSELRALFEQYGAIRTLYTACKHRGFVMISYYDIRAARTAMRALQNKPLRRRKLDIHFSIPKDNPSDKDINQGTLVVFNLDPSVSNDDLRQIFGAYGEVKEIRETPHKRHHKFIEFYDVRAAEAALRSLNRSDIAGKRIKLEPSRPGGARRKGSALAMTAKLSPHICALPKQVLLLKNTEFLSKKDVKFNSFSLMQQLSQDLEQDETGSFRHLVGSPIASSPPGNWGQFCSPVDHSPLQGLSQSPGSWGQFSSPVEHSPLQSFSQSPGLRAILPPQLSNSMKIGPISKDHGRINHVDQLLSRTNSPHGTFHPSHSFPESILSRSPGALSSFGPSTSNASGIGTLSGPQFLWGSPTLYSDHPNSSEWASSSVGHPFTSFLGSSRQHQVGSAPSGVPFERHVGFFTESPETSHVSRNEGSFMMNMGGRAAMSSGMTSIHEKGSPSFRMMPSQRLSPMFLGGFPYPSPGANDIERLMERGRSRTVETTGIDNKKQFQLDLDKIVSGEDTRTTLMIKNIPNKYTSKMLLAAIDENHRGTYDFLYLPIDFKNKCNVGYAFINMVSPSHIVSFYQAFNGKKWEKFNSEKVASLAYARIQGKVALVTHFQNSSLMNEDKRCRPILFHSGGQEVGNQISQEHFPFNNLNIVHQPDGSHFGDSAQVLRKGEEPDKS
ncbi:hypothetical protein GIB67_004185 [Kingdonia uniflora]|uniref:RRM domain-containing protein n=1 Tax=Kingdonia uniflora TaxID=39325 RepID=A0A7J7LLX6_9MAGN|nr:hypothetical protein GIB67_004185 [Kingdonia uniflora]